MSRLALTANERGIVVFKFFPSIKYGYRMLLSFQFITLGLFIQWLTGDALIGGTMLFAGNLLLLVNGYHKVRNGWHLESTVEWQTVDRSILDEVKALQRKVRKWDTRALDITNWQGFVVLAILVAALWLLIKNSLGMTRILGIDAALLLVPHWFTGIRRILLLPDLIIKIETIDLLLKIFDPIRFDYSVEIMMLMKGDSEHRIPDDVKVKVTTATHHQDFLGLYGQVVINPVKGKSYPYFYVVLVTRKGYGLQKAFDELSLSRDIIKEFKSLDEVDVIVIRQFTTRTSGYHSNEKRQRDIFRHGLGLMRQIATGPRE